MRIKYDRFWPINWVSISFEWNQRDMKGKPKLHILYEYQLNIYLTVECGLCGQIIAKNYQNPPYIQTIDIVQNNRNRVSIFFMIFSEST